MATEEYYSLKKFQIYQLSVAVKKERTGSTNVTVELIYGRTKLSKIEIEIKIETLRRKYGNICGVKISKIRISLPMAIYIYIYIYIKKREEWFFNEITVRLF